MTLIFRYIGFIMKLYCVRHGQAMSSDQDLERPLTQDGEQAITRLANFFKQSGLELSHILHSTKLRARQTATILGQALATPQVIECESILDEDSNVQPMVEMVQSWNEDTMLVGHMPFMPKLVNALTLGDASIAPIINFTPGTVVCLEHCQNGRWVVSWVMSPDVLSHD
jgi:phosphohistidine phosphatase